MTTKSFASDNNAGIHPDILNAIVNANVGHVSAYGSDMYTERAVKKFQDLFGSSVDVFFVFGGTAANVLGLQSATQSFNAVICAETSHICVDECGAPEAFTGCKLLSVSTANGKLTVESIAKHMHGFGDPHHVQPKVISITQSTEMGTVYTPDEIKRIADYAHEHGLFLHMDGARIANAVASLNVDIRKITKEVGVDILSFGGTKNGMMGGEAVVIFEKKLSANFPFIRKQGMQLSSKMRFISAQFETLLTDDLWLQNAKHANEMAKVLAERLKKISQVTLTQSVEANAVFAIIPQQYIARLQEKYFFYVWNKAKSEVRLMASFDTQPEDIENFVRCLQEITAV